MAEEVNNTFSGSTVLELMYGDKVKQPKVEAQPEVNTEVKKEVEPKAEVKTEEVIKTPLGDFKAEVKPEATPIDTFVSIKEKTGLEIKSEDELVERLNKLKELEANEALIKDNVQNKQIRELIGIIPEDLRAMLVAFENKQDYRSLGKTLFVEGIDFTKEVDKIDEFKLVSHYNPDLAKEDYDDMDAKAQTALINASRRSFNADKNAHNLAVQTAERTKNEYSQRVINSVEKAMEKLKKDFPNLTQGEIREIETRLYQDPTYDFIDSNTRTYREDAASKMAWQLYGPKTMKSVVDGMQSEINKKIEEGIKQRTSEELELIASQRGDTVKKLADTKDPAKEEIAKLKQRVGSWLQDSSSGLLNRYDRQPINNKQ